MSLCTCRQGAKYQKNCEVFLTIFELWRRAGGIAMSVETKQNCVVQIYCVSLKLYSKMFLKELNQQNNNIIRPKIAQQYFSFQFSQPCLMSHKRSRKSMKKGLENKINGKLWSFQHYQKMFSCKFKFIFRRLVFRKYSTCQTIFSNIIIQFQAFQTFFLSQFRPSNEYYSFSWRILAIFVKKGFCWGYWYNRLKISTYFVRIPFPLNTNKQLIMGNVYFLKEVFFLLFGKVFLQIKEEFFLIHNIFIFMSQYPEFPNEGLWKESTCYESEGKVNSPYEMEEEQRREKKAWKFNDWTIKEKTKYVVFLEKKSELMEGKPHSSLWEIYKKMSKFIKSRNYRQCKSYHQKQCIKFQSVVDIIAQFKASYAQILTQIQNQRESLTVFLEGKIEEKVSTNNGDYKHKGQHPTGMDYDEEQENIEKKDSQNLFGMNFMQEFMGKGGQSFDPALRKRKKEGEVECHSLWMKYVDKLKEIKMKEEWN